MRVKPFIAENTKNTLESKWGQGRERERERGTRQRTRERERGTRQRARERKRGKESEREAKIERERERIGICIGCALWGADSAIAAAANSPGVQEMQGRQSHRGAVNFGHGRFSPRDAFHLFKVDAKQLANFNVVKEDGIFGAHVKPEK